METETLTRACHNCGKTMRGRSDKKYCTDYCRNHFNNHIKGADNNYIRKVNGLLRRNRRILQALLPPDKTTVKTGREQLLLMGFHFGYFTQMHVMKKGVTCYYCYEYGYSAVSEQVICVMKKA